MEIIDTHFDYGPMTPRNISNVDLIILHHIGCEYATPEQIHQWHRAKGWAGIGYNFYVRKDGTIYRCRPMEYVPAHCSGYNTRSIGVAFEGNYEYEWMNDTQINAGKEIVSYLKNAYNINNVGKHKDYNATDCPGTNFPFEEIVSGGPVPPTPVPPPIPQDERIMVVQRWCNDHGQKIAVDGYFGINTFTAIVKIYQGCVGVKQDGIYGPKTYEASWRTISKGEKGTIVGTIQAMLICKGYEVALDEDFGDDTEFTLNGYQHDIGMAVEDDNYGALTQDTSSQLYT